MIWSKYTNTLQKKKLIPNGFHIIFSDSLGCETKLLLNYDKKVKLNINEKNEITPHLSEDENMLSYLLTLIIDTNSFKSENNLEELFFHIRRNLKNYYNKKLPFECDNELIYYYYSINYISKIN